MFLVKQKTPVFLLALVVGILISDFYLPQAHGIKCKTCLGVGTTCDKFEDWKEKDCKDDDSCKQSTCSACLSTENKFPGDPSKNSFVSKCATDDDAKRFTPEVCNSGVTIDHPDDATQKGTSKTCTCNTDLCDPRNGGGASGSGGAGTPGTSGSGGAGTPGTSGSGDAITSDSPYLHPSMVVIMSGLLCFVLSFGSS